MINTILFYLHHALNLLCGVFLSAAFCGVRLHKRNVGILLGIVALCGLTQLSTLYFSGGQEELVWQLYPLLVHLPLVVIFWLIFKRRFVTVVASVSLAYFCCQPSNYFGLLMESLTQKESIVWIIKITITLVVAFFVFRYVVSYITRLLNKDLRSGLIFCLVPLFYYGFDYIAGTYTDLWASHPYVIAEFLAFFLCVFFIMFCVVYCKEYEKKLDAEHKERIIRVAVEQQSKEIEAIKKMNLETGLMRHDMRFLLDNLSLCIDQGDRAQAQRMISGFIDQVETTTLHRYCKNDTINYVLTNYKERCEERKIDFNAVVEIQEISIDEVLFSSILSNALENAVNAQKKLPAEERSIKLMIKHFDNKLLLSIKNPYTEEPVFADGIPVTRKEGHGYGTQSIRYMTEKLGGKYQFMIKDQLFVLRVVI